MSLDKQLYSIALSTECENNRRILIDAAQHIANENQAIKILEGLCYKKLTPKRWNKAFEFLRSIR